MDGRPYTTVNVGARRDAPPVKATVDAQQGGRRELVRLAGSPARAAAVAAVLDGRPDDAEPDDGDKIAARQWAEDALAAEKVDRAAIRYDALYALRMGDIFGAVDVLRGLPPRELVPFVERFRRIGRRRGAA